MSLDAALISRIARVSTFADAHVAATVELDCGVLSLADGVRPEALLDRPCAVTIGAFDGVHVGHASLVSHAIESARRVEGLAVAVTFDPDPADVINGPAPATDLLAHDDRVLALMAAGVDAVLSVRFDEALASLDARSFFADVLAAHLCLREVVVGTNFRLGAGNAGTLDVIGEVGRDLGFVLTALPLVDDSGERVSSTRIRGLLADADVVGATRLLGREPIARGVVIHGRGEGHRMGFPTANLLVSGRICLPAEGVYAGLVCSSDEAWPAAINVGAPRSLAALGGSCVEGSHGSDGEPVVAAPSLEATLLGYEGDLYDHPLTVVFLRHLREPRTFESLDELKRVVLGNIDDVRRELGESVVRFSDDNR